MKKYFYYLLYVGTISLLLTACTGNADKDGFRSLEGPADPVNNGGKLSGDHIHHSPEKDSTAVKDSI